MGMIRGDVLLHWSGLVAGVRDKESPVITRGGWGGGGIRKEDLCCQLLAQVSCKRPSVAY
jgi:hypothetical protein